MEARLLPSGEQAVLVELPDAAGAAALGEALAGWAPTHEVTEVVGGARTVLVAFSGDAALARQRDALAALAASTAAALPPPDPGRTVVIPVSYDGEDLAVVAELTGLAPEEVVAVHTGRPWRVAFGGFAPGFAYLDGGDTRLAVPRRNEPRPSVPAGAVGLAGGYSGIYPRPSPGGWQLIGRTDAVLWDPSRDPAALLRPGWWVRFEVAR